MTPKPEITELFEPSVRYPDPDYRDRLSRLVGLDEKKATLTKILSLLVNPAGIEEWFKNHHPKAHKSIDLVLRRPPLIILAGDVGSGKTELAMTIGDAVALQEKISVTLFPLSLSTRGQGMVGEMTRLLSAAFDHTILEATKLKDKGKSRGAIILMVDEADALAQSRENVQMHHEDRAGVNAFIRGIDRLGNGKLPAAVIMCTNRIGALDPAIKRRAAQVLTFERPTEDQRKQVLFDPLTELGFDDNEIMEIVKQTGPNNGRKFGFTFSDLTQRLIPSIVLESYPDHAIDPKKAISHVRRMIPTSPFKEN